MSKLKVDTIRHTSATSDSITLVNDGKLVGLNQSSPTVGYGCDASLHIHSALSSGQRGAALHLTTNASGAAAGDGSRIAQVDNDLMVYNHEDGLLLLGINGNETVRVDDSAITFKAPDGGNRYFFGEMGNSASAELSLYDSSDSQKCKISADSSQHSFFNSGGNVGIGINNPSSAKLQIETQTDGGGTIIHASNNDNTGGDANYGGLMVKGGINDRECRFQSTSGSSYFTFRTEDSGGGVTEHFRIASNGDLTATDTSIGSNSDSRLKKNIVNYTYDLAKFKQFSTKTFDWINPEVHGNKSGRRGFLAQDLEAIDNYWIIDQILPNDSPDLSLLDADGIAKTSKLGEKDAMYVSIIQQLISKIETLETKVAALEAG